MGKVAHGDLALLVDVGEEGPAVVDAEVEDAVLVGRAERGTEDGAVGGAADGGEIQPVEGREHAEFELDGVAGGGDIRGEMVMIVFGDFDGEVLGLLVFYFLDQEERGAGNVGYVQHRS